MSVTNLDRDMFWLGTQAKLALPATATGLSAPDVISDGVAYTRHGFFQSNEFTLGGTAGQFRSWGCYLTWNQTGDPIPFRVKGYSLSADTVWAVAWESTVDTQEVVADFEWLGTGQRIDDVFCIREKSGYTDESLLFFAAVPADAGQSICGASIQKMLGRPDPYNSQLR